MYRDRLLEAGLNVSPVMDRVYFKSIYTKDPDGHIVELATMGPGFLVDEPVSTTGSTLRLPPWLEEHREQIEAHVEDIDRAPWPYDGSDGDRGMLSHSGRSLPIPDTMEASS